MNGIEKGVRRLGMCLFLLLLQTIFMSAVSADEKSFDPAEEGRVQTYIKQQKVAGKAPLPNSANWKPRFTCNDLKHFSWQEYQECRYYYAVNGRYYPD